MLQIDSINLLWWDYIAEGNNAYTNNEKNMNNRAELKIDTIFLVCSNNPSGYLHYIIKFGIHLFEKRLHTALDSA